MCCRPMPSCGTWESEALRSNVSTSSCCTSRYRSTGCQLQDLTFEAPDVSKETNIYFIDLYSHWVIVVPDSHIKVSHNSSEV